MLQLKIPSSQFYDENTNSFVQTKQQVLQLQHSLLSISKWQAKWKKPFLGKDPHTLPQTINYIQCMTLNKNVDPMCYSLITDSNIASVNQYIQDPMTATWFSKKNRKAPSRDIITSQLIYYWMVSLQIPFECQKWHLNRLLTLIRVCNQKNAPAKKMRKQDLAKRNQALNAARKQQLHTSG